MRYGLLLAIVTLILIGFATVFWTHFLFQKGKVPGLVSYSFTSTRRSGGVISYTLTFKVGGGENGVYVKSVEIYKNDTGEHLVIKVTPVGSSSLWLVSGNIEGLTTVSISPNPSSVGFYVDKDHVKELQLSFQSARPLRGVYSFVFNMEDGNGKDLKVVKTIYFS